MSTEFERIARLSAVFGSPQAPSVGIGDDCAVLHGGGPVVLTVDASVEGVHFRRDLMPLDTASERAVEAALSDVAAMGASVDVPGTGLLLAWTLPPWLTEEDFDALIRGAQRAALRVGTTVVGGNLASAPVLTLTTTVVGRAHARTIARGGACVGDVIAVTGVLGAAALGLRALLTGREKHAEAFVQRWRSPRARLDEGRAALEWAHAMIDVSDGLVQDLGHLATASQCALVVDARQLPMLEGQRELAASLGADPIDLALRGGEDYELAAAGPRETLPHGWMVIGKVLAGSGVRVTDGAVERPVAPGWDHFGPQRE